MSSHVTHPKAESSSAIMGKWPPGDATTGLGVAGAQRCSASAAPAVTIWRIH